MRVALSRPCPGVPFRPFQAAPLRTPAAICQNCGLPPIARPVAPGLLLMSLFLFAKLPLFSLTAKKIQRNFQEIFDFVDTQRVTKGYFSGFSVVKRFNRPCPWVWGGLECSGGGGYQCTHPRARVRMHAGTHHHRIFIKTFCFLLSASGRYICITANQIGENKTI